MAAEEVAVTREPGDGPPRGSSASSEERLNVSLLILQRVDHLELRVERFEDKMDVRFAAVDARFSALEDKMDARFAAVDARFSALEDKMDTRFGAVDARFAAMDTRFVAMDTRFAATDAKIDEVRRELSAKIDGQTAKMVWLFGLILVAVIAKVFIPHL